MKWKLRIYGTGLRWTVATFIPFTNPWRIYRDADRWIQKANRLLKQAHGSEEWPQWPGLRRDVFSVRFSIEQMLELLEMSRVVQTGIPELIQEWVGESL